jgi:hypothetical protein
MAQTEPRKTNPWEEFWKLLEAQRPQREAAIREGEEARRRFFEARAEVMRVLGRR